MKSKNHYLLLGFMSHQSNLENLEGMVLTKENMSKPQKKIKLIKIIKHHE